MPFSIVAATSAELPTERVRVAMTVRLDLGGRVLQTQASLSIADAPVKGYPTVEAEDIAAEGGDAVKIRTDKIGASGKALSHWDKRDHWIEWNISAPQAGRYRVAVRYCASEDAQRDLRIDGDLAPRLDRVVFPATGGLSGTTNDWGHAFVRDGTGNVAEWDLKAGPHKIRMTNLDDKPMNVDYLLLAPVK